MRIDALVTKSAAAKQLDSCAARAEQALLLRHHQWCEENEVHDRDKWRQPALHRSSGGQHPYPSFSNLFNTCYINAPLQCLLHCPAVRDVLLAAADEGDPFLLDWRGEMLDQFPRTAFGCRQGASHFRRERGGARRDAKGVRGTRRAPPEELHALATACVRGAPLLEELAVGEAPARARVDRWSPHACVDAFLAKHGQFKLGAAEDASEALALVVDDVPILRHLFQCDGEVVTRLPHFVDGASDDDDAASPQAFFTGAQRLDMRSLLCRALSMGGRLQGAAPELLAIRVPPHWERGDGAVLSLGGCDVVPDWGERPEVALRVGEEDVAYRLRAYVQ